MDLTQNGSTDFTQLAVCVEAIGTPDFPSAISEYCKGLCHADLVFLSAFFDGHQPLALYANHVDPAQKEALALYLDVAHVLDPFFILYREKRGDQVATLAEVAPDDFKRSDYYQQFYKALGLADECGLMLHLADDAALFFFVWSGGQARKNRPVAAQGGDTADHRPGEAALDHPDARQARRHGALVGAS